MPEIPIGEPTNPADVPPNSGQNLKRTLQLRLVAAWEKIQRLPRKQRLAGAVLAMLLIGFLIFSFTTSDSTKLNIVCQHNFRSAELSIWIDSNLVYSGNVSGSVKKRFGWLGSSKGKGLYKTVNVPSGRHTLQVRVNAAAERYDQTKTMAVAFAENQDNSLSISAGNRGLYLMSRGSANISVESDSSTSYGKYVSSVLISLFGSGMSAAIAFLVQEFLRSQKARLTVAASATEAKT